MRVAIVAGETSGDLLAADLLRALKKKWPELQAEGVTGPAMRDAGCDSLADMQELAVMGIAEVLGELPRLLKLRKSLLAHWQENPPDLFIGVDAPDFNLGLATKLKATGVPTVHYVSPTVWAWRPKRVFKIEKAADIVLCLFPFEPDCYRETKLKAVYVGHPFAAQIDGMADKASLRKQFGIEADQQVLTLCPGSRMGEITRLGDSLAATVKRLLARMPTLKILVPAANAKVGDAFAAKLSEQGIAVGEGQAVQIMDGQMRELLRAADAAIVTSGTATLETMLLGTPFVVAYKAAPFTAWLLRGVGLLKIDQVALPNILAGQEVAPELLQGAAEAENLAAASYQLLRRPHLAAQQNEIFAPLAKDLHCDSASIAAQAIEELLQQRGKLPT